MHIETMDRVQIQKRKGERQMSYQAKMTGTIILKGEITSDQKKEVINILGDTGYCSPEIYKMDGNTNIDYADCGRYNDDDIKNALDELKKKFKVKSGELVFIGEDDTQWCLRYVEKPEGDPSEPVGGWEELRGEVAYVKYGMPGYQQLLDMFISYVTNDLEGSGNPEYVREALSNCGCDANMQKMLGLETAA